MNKPDPSKSRIRSIFTETFSNVNKQQKEDELEQLKTVGPLLFSEAEIYATPHSLDKVLRKFCVENNITEAYFTEKFKIFALQELGMHPVRESNNRSNTIKSLKAGYITYKTFIKVMCMVLGYTIEEMTFVFSDDDGTTQQLSFKESNAKISKASTLEFKEGYQ